MKVVIVVSASNAGDGYALSREAYKELGLPWGEEETKNGCGYAYMGDRANPRLVACIEKLGDSAAQRGCKLRIINIPDDVSWYIERDYDEGYEFIRECHRVWQYGDGYEGSDYALLPYYDAERRIMIDS